MDAQKGFWRSLTSALLATASQAIDVPRTELNGLFRLSENASDGEEIVIYDNVPEGAGYSRRIGSKFEMCFNALTRLSNHTPAIAVATTA